MKSQDGVPGLVHGGTGLQISLHVLPATSKRHELCWLCLLQLSLCIDGQLLLAVSRMVVAFLSLGKEANSLLCAEIIWTERRNI